VFCVGLLWYDLVVIEGGEGGFVDVFYAGLLEFDAVSAVKGDSVYYGEWYV